MRQFVETLQKWDFRVCGVFLVDSKFMVNTAMFFSGVLAALSAMIQLELPHINVMAKMDLLSKSQANDITRWVANKLIHNYGIFILAFKILLIGQ